MIGRRTMPLAFEPKNTDEIKRILKYTGISNALAYHSLAVEYHPIEGNMKLIEDIAGDDFFIPVWVVMPCWTNEFPEPAELRLQLALHRIKALRVSPGVASLNYSIDEWSMGNVFKLAEELRLPLMVDLEYTTWRDLYSLSSGHPQLKIIVTKVGYRNARFLYPIMMQCKNIHIDISMYKNHLGIEHLCNTFGSERLLYGSAMPSYSPGSAKAMVLNADIGENERINIAGGNILRLIGDVRYE
jgi:Predicted metal-dependent hydrolase of the TIM-barrel fold